MFDRHIAGVVPPNPRRFFGPREGSTRSSPVKINETKKIFISYRRDDSGDITGRIYDRIINLFGRDRVFMDTFSIQIGANFKKVLQEEVGKCHVMLAVIGDNWLGALESDGTRRLDNPKDFVRLEIEAALQRSIPIIPLFVKNVTNLHEDQLPAPLKELAYYQGLPIRRDPDFTKDIETLIRELKRLLNE